MKKNQRVRLYGNDDPRPVYAHPDDLHPHSRMRATIHHDRKTKLRCNIARDVLRSMVASQRHNRLLTTGEATLEELVLELGRDCITIVHRPIEASHPVAHLCRSLADALVTWPRMLFSMKHIGAPCDYSVGPTHAVIRIGRKARYQPNLERNRPCKELVRAFCACHEAKTLDEVKRLFSRDALRAWLKQQPLFWYNRYDNGKASAHPLHAAVCEDASFVDVLMDELGRYWHACPELDRVFERFDDESQHAPAVDVLFDAIGELGWTVRRFSASNACRHPLVFPTACVTSPRDDGCSIDMLLQPPLP